MNFSQGIPEQKFNVNRACFPEEKHQNSQKWAKFMNFSFCPFLWFGLPGRLLTKMPAILRKFGAVCDKCAQRPRDRPLLGISEFWVRYFQKKTLWGPLTHSAPKTPRATRKEIPKTQKSSRETFWIFFFFSSARGRVRGSPKRREGGRGTF